MPRRKGPASRPALERFLDEASWLLSHAPALADSGLLEEAAAEWARAANAEEQVACLPGADSQEQKAAIHRLRAASCQEMLGQFSRAVTLLRPALAAPLAEEYRARVGRQRARCLAGARRQGNGRRKRGAGKRASALS
jgi:hypothetical protein